MADSVMKWYVVRAIGGQENKVKSYIETEISRVGLSDYVSQVIVPTEKVIQIRNGKKVNRERVYFPGYIMVEANLSGEVPHVIKSITGVIGFFCIFGAYRIGSPSTIAPYEYSLIIWSIVLGYLIWNEYLSFKGFIGLFLILLASFFTLYREYTLNVKINTDKPLR